MGIKLIDYWQRRVQRGVMWLDITIPGWVDRIDLNTLDMRYNDDCIAGQLMQSDDFYEFAKKIVPDICDFGLDVGYETEKFLTVVTCENCVHEVCIRDRRYRNLLTKLWVVEIVQRRFLDKAEIPSVKTKREVQIVKQKIPAFYEL